MTYANVTRLYCANGTCSPSLYAVAKTLPVLTLKRNFSCGGPNGTWEDSPFKEIINRPASVPAQVLALNGTQRHLDWQATIPALFDAVRQSIAASWRPEAFHVIFHSSGYDSRIISAAIKQLMLKNGKDWLGQGVLFLSNRWEATPFYAIMQAQGWDVEQHIAFTEGPDAEHFALGLCDLWASAPLPIPGNLWRYLIQWAQGKSMLPATNLQTYTGLWANEAWNAFLSVPNPWKGFVETWYGYNCMAALPVLTEWVEYPLIDTNVLELLSRITPCSGDILRARVAQFADPDTLHIERLPYDDRKHVIAPAQRVYLEKRYADTYVAQIKPWTAPSTSEFSNDWGWYGLARLVDRLRGESVNVS